MNEALREMKDDETLEVLSTLGLVTAGIVHELNHPLAFLKGNLDVLKSSLDEKESNSLHPLVDDCLEGVERIALVIQHVRSFLDGERAPFSEINLRTSLEEAIRIARFVLGNECLIRLQIADPITFSCCSGQVIRAVENLLINAGQAMGGRGDILVIASQNEDMVMIEIVDQGEGIPEEIRGSIFQPFYSKKTKKGGLGLGLWIVQKIAKRHGGWVDFESHLGRGTTFRLCLPLNP